jgi:hypothetical protein
MPLKMLSLLIRMSKETDAAFLLDLLDVFNWQ